MPEEGKVFSDLKERYKIIETLENQKKQINSVEEESLIKYCAQELRDDCKNIIQNISNDVITVKDLDYKKVEKEVKVSESISNIIGAIYDYIEQLGGLTEDIYKIRELVTKCGLKEERKELQKSIENLQNVTSYESDLQERSNEISIFTNKLIEKGKEKIEELYEAIEKILRKL